MPTCGPAVAEAVCPACALDVGLDLWCDGHAATGEAVLAAVRTLPPEWAVATRLWWVATGEVRLGTLVLPPDDGLPRGITEALGD